ncbi:MAG: tetratricopeptide repeat protein [Candidatus Rokuibacteriota bacterium]
MNARRVVRWLGGILAGGLLASALMVLIGGPSQWRTRGLVQSGATLVSEERYLPAIRHLVRAVATEPRDARAHYYLGLAYAGLGQDAAALGHAEDAVRLAPREPQYEAGLATLLIEAGRMPEAIAHLRRAADIRPRSAEIRLLLADTLHRAGDSDGMEREYRTVIRLARGRPLAEVARGRLRAAREESLP